MQGWFSHRESHTFFANKNILPIYIGYHLEPYKVEDLLYLLRYIPNYFQNKTIGCRDKDTKAIFESLNIPAYLSRCLTLTYPQVEQKNPDTIFFVDIYDCYLKYIPQEFYQGKYEKVTQRGCDTGFSNSYYMGTSEKYYFDKATKQLDEYKDRAKLVITTCLHCAAPCIAMGIPVIVFCYNDDKSRYTALDGIVPIYTMEDLKNDKVNWNPTKINIEDLKQYMIKNFELSVKEALGEHINKNELKQIRNMIENYNILS